MPSSRCERSPNRADNCFRASSGRFRFRKRNEPWNWNLQSHDRAVLGQQRAKFPLEKSVELSRGTAFEIAVDQPLHFTVIIALAVRVDVVAAPHASDVAVEPRIDVIQLVENGDHLLAEGMVEKPRQVEREDVEDFDVTV